MKKRNKTVDTPQAVEEDLIYISKRRKSRNELITSKKDIVAELSKKEADKERRRERNETE